MIPMADSIVPGNLPPYPAYLGYVDGKWPTAPAIRKAHPAARLLTLTVTGATDDADGCDQEAGDLGPNTAAMWLKRQLLAGKKRPVLYASRDDVPLTLSILAPLGTGRADIRILSAHYGQGEHICSPAACGASFTADGTQYSDTAPGLNGTTIDLSILNDDFFGVSNVTGIPLDILGSYTNNAGDLFVIGTDADGVLHESKRTAMGVWSAPYPIAGKVGA